jgi:DNA-binding FrmR family transcriptional regulator
MLPDFPRILAELDKLINKRLRYRVRMGHPIISMAGHTTQHEGDRMVYSTVNGTQKEMLYEESRSVFGISREEMKSLTIEDIIKKIDAVAEEMTGGMARMMYSHIEQITKEAGTAIDQGGKPFTFENLLEAIDRIWIDFDEETGQPHMPTIVMHPSLHAKIKDKIPEWENNPEYKKKFEELMKHKYKEWHDRESNRKLVD